MRWWSDFYVIEYSHSVLKAGQECEGSGMRHRDVLYRDAFDLVLNMQHPLQLLLRLFGSWTARYVAVLRSIALPNVDQLLWHEYTYSAGSALSSLTFSLTILQISSITILLNTMLGFSLLPLLAASVALVSLQWNTCGIQILIEVGYLLWNIQGGV